ncbi:hypothetical protein PAHAL_9G158200 [Panicum hallii]|uniref:Uncharacterized protein n=1 Tax=Panicum hallii TaxID=206008 RepID=A0A2S3IJQ1_9POAL|nr:hypothetical protein PAHAL_9G158200 [Panicum hallii]
MGPVCARGILRAYTSPRDPIFAARWFRERERETEGEEGGGSRNPWRRRGTSVVRLLSLLLQPVQSAYVYIQALTGSCPFCSVLHSAPLSSWSARSTHVAPPPPSSALLFMLGRGYTLLCCLLCFLR